MPDAAHLTDDELYAIGIFLTDENMPEHTHTVLSVLQERGVDLSMLRPDPSTRYVVHRPGDTKSVVVVDSWKDHYRDRYVAEFLTVAIPDAEERAQEVADRLNAASERAVHED